MQKEGLLQILQDKSLSRFNFSWVNAHRLSVTELGFVVGLVDQNFILSKLASKVFNGDVAKIEEEMEKIIQEQGITVIHNTMAESG